jgi:hypothetical protein
MIPQRIPLERIHLGPNVVAGCNVLVVMSLTHMMRGTHKDPDPVLVNRCGDHWSIHDGRHRFVAAVMAGRPDLLCAEAPTPL